MSMKQLYIDFESRSTTISDDYGCNGPYTGFRETETTIDVNGLLRESEETFGETVDVSDETYKADAGWLVVVRYSTGGTFSREHGRYEFVAVFNNVREAKALAKEIQKDNDSSKKFSFTPQTKNVAYNEIHCSWKGYFERLENVEVLGLEIQ